MPPENLINFYIHFIDIVDSLSQNGEILTALNYICPMEYYNALIA